MCLYTVGGSRSFRTEVNVTKREREREKAGQVATLFIAVFTGLPPNGEASLSLFDFL